MKRLIILLLPLMLLFGCMREQEVIRTFCSCEEREEMSEWLSKTIPSANNMADEEMEDVISELKKTGIFLFCHDRKVIFISGQGYDVSSFPQDSCMIMYR